MEPPDLDRQRIPPRAGDGPAACRPTQSSTATRPAARHPADLVVGLLRVHDPVCLPVLVLGHEEGRRFFQELPVHPQLRRPQPLQLGPLIGVQRPRRVIRP